MRLKGIMRKLIEWKNNTFSFVKKIKKLFALENEPIAGT
jgi:hypothetical protein